ncbi:molybdate ABC transporter substrate-binding protein [Pseudooceanicola spongiae]|uniref:Molybdate-binding protein ModA n=1 Tax=Pseudooceanicola spongiae TaxID=2613965 RepID=A0A7L9WGJ1_9RHOB|nr:molybdate ABC transporter substrate-binding protein [Pseudooceanicola spongiae]QOL79445.1 molybdate ABC transporter substrate-binding protein [Pseudooceanicola spongiae]
MTRGRVLGCVAALVIASGGAQAGEGRLTVFAAASMKNAMDEIAAGYEAETGNVVDVSLAGSSALARQIQQGAPADIFISANTDWMDRLEAEGLINADSRFDLLGNAIVLVAAKGAAPVDIGPDMDLAARLNGGRLAMALVEAVPAGIYGKASLEALGQWDSVAPMVAQADNVRAALALVAVGAAPMGIVYASDAVAEPRVDVVGTFPADSHPPIVYPAAKLSSSDNPLDAGFLAYLRGAEARAAFERQGFAVLAQE